MLNLKFQVSTGFLIIHTYSLQCRRVLGGWNLVRVRNVVVAPIFDFMTWWQWKVGERNGNPYRTVGAWAKDSPHLLLSSRSFNMALSRANCALKENACTAGYHTYCNFFKKLFIITARKSMINETKTKKNSGTTFYGHPYVMDSFVCLNQKLLYFL